MLTYFKGHRFSILICVGGMIAGLMTASGCQQITGDSTVQVIGEVRIDRRPLADARVALIPIELRGRGGTINPIAFGKTDNAGRFEARSSQAKGVAPGEYRILFFKPRENTASQFLAPPENGNPPPVPNNEIDFESQRLLNLMSTENFEVGGVRNSGGTDVGAVPASYNIESQLKLTVSPGSGIIYPQFDLQSVPEN